MSTGRTIVLVLVLSILVSGSLLVAGNVQAAVGKWEVFEVTLTTTNSYSNPYTQVTLDATFTSPTSQTIQTPGFWDGGQTWKVRVAPNEIGTWTYSTTKSWVTRKDFGRIEDGARRNTTEYKLLLYGTKIIA